MKGQIVTLTTLVILTAASKSSNERRSKSSNKQGDSGRQEEFRKMKTVPLFKQYQETNAYKSNKTGRALGYMLDNDQLTIISRGEKGVLVLRFSVEDGPRLGLQWHRNHSIAEGENPDIHHSIRLYGLIETNQTVSINSKLGTDYIFRNFHWSNLRVGNVTDEVTGVKKYFVTANGTSVTTLKEKEEYHRNTAISKRNTISMTVTVWFSADAVNTTTGMIRPNGFKYSILISGSPTQTLNNSSWELVKFIYSNRNKTNVLDTTALGDGVSRFDWDPSVTIDGVDATIQRTENLNASIADLPSQFANRDGILDGRCHAFNIITFKIPHFKSSFYWDPSIAIDETKAQMTVEDLPASYANPTSYAKLESSPYLAFSLAIAMLILL
jgi:hypothetical protein